VVHPKQVEKSVEHEDADFVGGPVAALGRLGGGARGGNDDFA
jgi:hypothetical protein